MGLKKHLLAVLCLLLVTTVCPPQRASTPTPIPPPSRTPPIRTAPIPTPSPTPNLSPRPLPDPSPYPTPVIDVQSYLPAVIPGPTINVSTAHDVELGALISRAEAELATQGRGGTIRVTGTGRIASQPIVNHHLVFDGSELRCAQQKWAGCVILGDGVLVEFINGAFIYEPPVNANGVPEVTVFQSLADYTSLAHEKMAHNIAIVGATIKGVPQKVHDGGVRSTIQFGNIENYAVINAHLIDTAGLGIDHGGSSAAGNFARHGLSYHNVFEGVPSAAEAIVNAEDVIVVGDIERRPGGAGGGISLVDVEPNDTPDHAAFIQIYNSRCDYTGAFPLVSSVGNCINIQNPYHGKNVHDNIAANNVIWGGDPTDPKNPGPLSNGILISYPQPGLKIIANTITQAVQSGIQVYGFGPGAGELYQDNALVSCGGGGNLAFSLWGVNGATLNRNRLFDAPGTVGSTDPRIHNCGGSGNVFRDNRKGLVELAGVTAECPVR